MKKIIDNIQVLTDTGQASRHSRNQSWLTALKVTGRLLIAVGIIFCLFTLFIAVHYGVTVRVAAADLVRQSVLLTIQSFVSVYDPCNPRVADLGPAKEKTNAARKPRLDDVLTLGNIGITPRGSHVTAVAINNAKILRSPYSFGYQPYDDARLQQIREQYQLDRVVESAYSEFDAMVQIRSWARSLYRRSESQDQLENFNALDLIARRKRPRSQDPSVHDYDPCHLFPLLYAQLMASMGYQSRIISVGHAVVEVWSNQYARWVLMDAEFDHHFEKDGIPLGVVEVLEENFHVGKSVHLVRGMRYPMLENPTMVHLNRDVLRAEDCIPWFKAVLEVADLRNDWLTNHYFVGHPKRSEANSLVYTDPRLKIEPQVAFRLRLRPKTERKSDMYWTLNQAEILYRSWKGGELELEFDTVTPNFQNFEIVLDGKDVRKHPSSIFRWAIHEGENTLVVRPVNRFGVVGVESTVSLSVSSASPAASGSMSISSVDPASDSRIVEGDP